MWCDRRKVPGQSGIIAIAAYTECEGRPCEIGTRSGVVWLTVNTGRKHTTSECTARGWVFVPAHVPAFT